MLRVVVFIIGIRKFPLIKKYLYLISILENTTFEMSCVVIKKKVKQFQIHKIKLDMLLLFFSLPTVL